MNSCVFKQLAVFLIICQCTNQQLISGLVKGGMHAVSGSLSFGKNIADGFGNAFSRGNEYIGSYLNSQDSENPQPEVKDLPYADEGNNDETENMRADQPTQGDQANSQTVTINFVPIDD